MVCLLAHTYVRCILYNDDIIILEQIVSAMQNMLDIRNDEIITLDLQSNEYIVRRGV